LEISGPQQSEDGGNKVNRPVLLNVESCQWTSFSAENLFVYSQHYD